MYLFSLFFYLFHYYFFQIAVKAQAIWYWETVYFNIYFIHMHIFHLDLCKLIVTTSHAHKNRSTDNAHLSLVGDILKLKQMCFIFVV